MYATAVHRDREAVHEGHYRIDCLSTAPKAVKVKSRRSIRAAGRASLRHALIEALAERSEQAE